MRFRAAILFLAMFLVVSTVGYAPAESVTVTLPVEGGSYNSITLFNGTLSANESAIDQDRIHYRLNCTNATGSFFFSASGSGSWGSAEAWNGVSVGVSTLQPGENTTWNASGIQIPSASQWPQGNCTLSLRGQNNLGGDYFYSANVSFAYDTVASGVRFVNATAAPGVLLANGNYKAGDKFNFTVTFNETVVVSGTPLIYLEMGSTDRAATYLTNSSATVLVFNYTVNTGDTSSDLDYNGTAALVLNSGTINDTAQNAATLTLAATNISNFQAIVIDTTAPTVRFVNATAAPGVLFTNGTYGAGTAINFTVTFSETVIISGTNATLQLNLTTPRNATYLTNSSATTLVFNYTVQSSDLSADLDYTGTGAFVLGSGTTINDSAQNAANLTLAATNISNFQAIAISTAPAISSVSSSVTTSTATVTWTTDLSADSSVTVSGSSFTSSTFTTSHSVSVTGLTAGTAYTATIQSCNSYSRCGNSSATFTTTASSGGSAATAGGGGGGGATPLPSSTTVVQSIEADTSQSIGVSKADEIGIISVEVEVIADVSNVEVTVAKLAAKPASAATEASATVYRYVDVTTKRLESEDIKQVTFDFKVEKSWLTENGVQPADVVLLRYADGEWNELTTQQTSSDATYMYYTATSPGFSYFAIGLKKTAEPVTPPVTPPVEPPVEPPVTPPVEPPVTPPVEPPVTPPVEPTKGFFQSALFTIAVGTVLAVTGVGFIYRNRLVIGAKIDDLLGKLKRGREDRLKRK